MEELLRCSVCFSSQDNKIQVCVNGQHYLQRKELEEYVPQTVEWLMMAWRGSILAAIIFSDSSSWIVPMKAVQSQL